MPALEPSRASASWPRRPRSTPARWAGDDVDVLRLAPDEALGLRRDRRRPSWTTRTRSSSRRPASRSRCLDADELATLAAHAEWPLAASATGRSPRARSPASRRRSGWLDGDRRSLLVAQAAYADELAERLGWRCLR